MKYIVEIIAVLDVAKIAAGALPVAGDIVGAALDVALVIAKQAKSTEDTKEDCHALALRAAQYTLVVYEALRCSGTAVDGQDAQKGVAKLLSTLQDIQGMMERNAKKGFIRGLLRIRKSKEELATLTQALEDAITSFEIDTAIRIDTRMSNIEELLERMLQDLTNVGSTVVSYARAQAARFVEVQGQLATIVAATDRSRLSMVDVKLLESLDEDKPSLVRVESTRQGEEVGAVKLYRGELRADGSPVLVKQFKEHDGTYRNEIERHKALLHPGIIHLRGYSIAPEIAFIAYDMEPHVGSFEALSRSVRGLDKLLWILNATRQIHDAFLHLASHAPGGLQWTSDDDIDPIMGGGDLVVTADSRVLVDVSRCRLDRLPNLVILYEWTIELHGPARRLVQDIKKNPLAGVPVWKQRDALSTLWRQVALFAHFEREETLFWNPRRAQCLRVVYPGECFLRDSGKLLEGLWYEDQVQRHTLEVKCIPGMMCPERIIEDDQGADPSEDQPSRAMQKKIKDKVKRKKDTRKAYQVEEKALRYEVPPEDLLFSAPYQNVVYERWRRYTVHGLNYGWRLHTTTVVRESGDCEGWLLNQAPGLCDFEPPLDLNNLAISTALKFTTQTYLVGVFTASGRQQPPPTRTLYFYEHVHDYPRATLAMDGQLNWPWGFWSTEPDDRCEAERSEDAHRPGARHSINFAGVTDDGVYRWLQIVDDCMLSIDVRVEVEYCSFTQDECTVLEKIQEASVAEAEWQAGPDAWRMDVDPDDDSEMATDSEESMMEWEDEGVSAADADDEEEWFGIDERTIAAGLYWLRVRKEYAVYAFPPNAMYTKKGE